MDIWIYRYIYICGYIDKWIYGYILIYGYMDAWIYGYISDTVVSFIQRGFKYHWGLKYGYIDILIWLYDYMDICIHEYMHIGVTFIFGVLSI